MMRWLLSVFVLVLSSAAQQYPIIALQASGSERYQPAEIIAATGVKVDIGKPGPLAAVRAAAQKLVDSGVFSDVSYRHSAATGGMSVQFTVKDKGADQFLLAVFENIVWLPDTELREQISQRLPLFHGDLPLNGRLEDDVAEQIAAILKQRNIDAHVSSIQSCDVGAQHCTREFSVDNIQIDTAKLDLTGAPAEIAAEVQQAANKSVLGKPYSRSRTGAEVTRIIRAACLRRGLLKPQLSDITATPSDAPSGGVGVTVRASVAPGPAYRFEGQTWAGNTAIETAKLEKMVHLYQHLPVDGAKLDADLQQVRAQFALRGYMQARITAQPRFDDSQGTVQYTFAVKEGPLYKMGKLDLSGFPDKMVDQVSTLWKLREGDPFDHSYVLRFFADPKIAQLFSGRKFVVEQSEGDTPQIVDISINLCDPAGCKPSPNALFISAQPEESPESR
jgi:outer membrane protein assembly factor BamA